MGQLRTAWRLLRAAVSAWIDDHAPSMGAALAYYTLFSMAPLLLIAISVAGLVFGEQAARGEVMEQIAGLMGTESARAVESMLASLNKPAAGIGGTLLGFGVLLIGATTVFAELQSALDRIWRVPTREPLAGWWSFLRARLLSLGMVLATGFLILVSLLAGAALSALHKWWGPWFADWARVAEAVNAAISFLLVTVVFAVIYKWMPRTHVAWKDVWIGAVVTAALFTAGKSLIATYIGTSGVASGFGAAASLVVVLVWVYYSAQIFLLGAEFTWVYALRHGSLKGSAVAAAALEPTSAPANAPAQPAPVNANRDPRPAAG